ncbi:MAG: uracil-DNA glycosylase [Tissierellia bacterium]|mgnify:CR=1 FL=1|nr:uracil-DNA glycosylase [Tissierellia bacterium]
MKEKNIKLLNDKINREFSKEKLILGHGNLTSPIVLIGEAPGAKEIELGQPFVGQAGKHFDEFLQVLEINRKDVYITNTVKYRPTKLNPKTGRLSNRTPTIKEIDNFRDYLYEEIHIIDPKIIVTLGNTPLKGIFNEDLKIGEVHGNLMEKNIEDNLYKIFPLYHPAAVIYRRELKEVYMRDLLVLKEIIKKL